MIHTSVPRMVSAGDPCHAFHPGSTRRAPRPAAWRGSPLRTSGNEVTRIHAVAFFNVVSIARDRCCSDAIGSTTAMVDEDLTLLLTEM